MLKRLGKDKVPGVSKLERRLEELGTKWDAIKKAQPGAKSGVEPVQVSMTRSGGGRRAWCKV